MRTWSGWLYLAVVLDLHSRRVVGWSVADHMRTDLVLNALTTACELRQPRPGLVVHSDRGSQYASNTYRKALEERGFVCSMSRKSSRCPGVTLFARRVILFPTKPRAASSYADSSSAGIVTAPSSS